MYSTLGIIAVGVMMFIASIDCDVCANRKCAKIPKHYEELGCKEIKENEACCATSYECPDFKSYDTSKCHLRGKQYNVSDTLAENDAPIFLAACECHIHDKEPAAFECAIVECPEHFDGGDSSDECAENCTSTHNSTLCISIYENATSYCRIKEICDENEIAMLPTCYYDDKVYHLGEKFEPIAHPCYECMCTETFDNATAIGDNANCAKLDCGIEVREMKNIRNGCVPVYYGRESCCPIEYRCPASDDQIMDSDLELTVNGSTDATCTFDNVTLRIDQQLQTSDKCMECKCAIPPMITCTQLPIG